MSDGKIASKGKMPLMANSHCLKQNLTTMLFSSAIEQLVVFYHHLANLTATIFQNLTLDHALFHICNATAMDIKLLHTKSK